MTEERLKEIEKFIEDGEGWDSDERGNVFLYYDQARKMEGITIELLAEVRNLTRACRIMARSMVSQLTIGMVYPKPEDIALKIANPDGVELFTYTFADFREDCKPQAAPVESQKAIHGYTCTPEQIESFNRKARGE